MLTSWAHYSSVDPSLFLISADLLPGRSLLLLGRLALVVSCILVVEVDLVHVDLVLGAHVVLNLEALASVARARKL